MGTSDLTICIRLYRRHARWSQCVCRVAREGRARTGCSDAFVSVVFGTGEAEQCVKCGNAVEKAEGCKFGPKTYHIKCLCCSQCGELSLYPPLPLILPTSFSLFIHSFLFTHPSLLPCTFFFPLPFLSASLVLSLSVPCCCVSPYPSQPPSACIHLHPITSFSIPTSSFPPLLSPSCWYLTRILTHTHYPSCHNHISSLVTTVIHPLSVGVRPLCEAGVKCGWVPL